MSFTSQEWQEEYERTKTLLIQLRSGPGPAPSSQVASAGQGIDRLDYRLSLMEQNPQQFRVGESEVIRRRELVKGLRKQMQQGSRGGCDVADTWIAATSIAYEQDMVKSSASSITTRSTFEQSMAAPGKAGPRTLAQQQRMVIQEQDELLEDLGKGVERLMQQGRNINEEANLHVRLLDDMDIDVERASTGLKQEAKHAEKIREQSSVCRLYMTIAILTTILLLLIILGFS